MQSFFRDISTLDIWRITFLDILDIRLPQSVEVAVGIDRDCLLPLLEGEAGFGSIAGKQFYPTVRISGPLPDDLQDEKLDIMDFQHGMRSTADLHLDYGTSALLASDRFDNWDMFFSGGIRDIGLEQLHFLTAAGKGASTFLCKDYHIGAAPAFVDLKHIDKRLRLYCTNITNSLRICKRLLSCNLIPRKEFPVFSLLG